MRIEHIEYVLEAARCNSISKAAQNLFIGQPTLSMAINAVENELQGKIFYRTNKGIRLTEFGEQILPELWEIMRHNRKIKELSNRTDELMRNHIHFTSYPAGSFAVMPEVIAKIKQAHPKAALHVYDIQPEGVVKHLIAGGYNIGLSALSAVKYRPLVLEAKNYGFVCKKLYEDKMMAYVHKDNPLADETLTVEKLKDSEVMLMHFFTLPNENAFYSDFRSFDSVCTFSNYDVLKRAIVSRKALTIAPKLVFYNDIYLAQEELIEKPIADFNETLINFIVYPQDERKITILESAMLENIEKFFRSLPQKI